MFIGRERERKRLEKAYVGHASEFIPIYGRRRVGKSALIVESLGGRHALFYVGKVAPAALQLRQFLEQAARVVGEPLLAHFETNSWRHALLEVAQRWPKGKKFILVLDEFQWMAGASPELPSVLQELWDLRWKKSGRVCLILCGSYVGFMEREVLGKKSPLFGRRTAQIRLGPFSFRDAARFHPTWSRQEQARAYFVCGGVPWYLEQFDASVSVDKNIERQVLSDFSPMYAEPEFLLREELREVERYYAALLAIATGHHTVASIAKVARLPESGLHYYLQQLLNLGYIGRRYPLTERAPVKRHVRYVVTDPLLRFWFRFVFPNTSDLEQYGAAHVFREQIRPVLPAYEGMAFEMLCREALPYLYAEQDIATRVKVGEYWDKHVQIDVVGRRHDNWIDLGECKWGTVRSLPKLAAELAAKIPHYPNTGGATVGLWFFLKKQPAAKRLPTVPNARWVGLEQLYGDTA